MLQTSRPPTSSIQLICRIFCVLTAALLTACTTNATFVQPASSLEVRGTWITTTANTAVATPADTANTMRRLRQIGLNTVYVEVWKNGYTQYPSEVLRRTIGVDRRPALMPQDPSDRPEALKQPGRDLLQEMLIEAHRNGLITVAWFEYGFMAAHKSSNPHLRRMKPEWLSRDIKGSEIAPNGFVWMNPLHPEARQFLLDLVLEAIDHYDLDGIRQAVCAGSARKSPRVTHLIIPGGLPLVVGTLPARMAEMVCLDKRRSQPCSEPQCTQPRTALG